MTCSSFTVDARLLLYKFLKVTVTLIVPGSCLHSDWKTLVCCTLQQRLSLAH